MNSQVVIFLEKSCGLLMVSLGGVSQGHHVGDPCSRQCWDLSDCFHSTAAATTGTLSRKRSWLTKVFPVIPTGSPFQSLLEVHYHSATTSETLPVKIQQSPYQLASSVLPRCTAFLFFCGKVVFRLAWQLVNVACRWAGSNGDTTMVMSEDFFLFKFFCTEFGTKEIVPM